MAKAGNYPIEITPSLSHEVFGFKPDGSDVNIPLSSIYNLFGKAASGVTNKYVLSKSTLAEGSFVTNSLLFDEIAGITFNNVDSYGTSMVSFFTLLNTNKRTLLLKIKKMGFETSAYFKIIGITFNANTLTLSVSLYNNLKLGVLTLGDEVYVDVELENSLLLTENQIDRLRDSVYLPIIQSISVSPTTFEKGLATNLVFTWNVDKKDDTLNTCTVDSIDKLAEATGVNRTYNVNGQVGTKTVSLVTEVTRNDVSGGSFTTSSQATSTEIIPQYFGLVASGDEAPLTYALLNPDPNTNLKKFISATSAKSVVLGTDLPTPSNQHFFFLSTNANAVIIDVNGFNVTPAFTKTTVTMKLADGTDQSITQYKTTLTLNSTGTFTIN